MAIRLVSGMLEHITLIAKAACLIPNLGAAGMLPPTASRYPTGVDPKTPKLDRVIRFMAFWILSLTNPWPIASGVEGFANIAGFEAAAAVLDSAAYVCCSASMGSGPS